jgi:uncharacterized membrane protein
MTLRSIAVAFAVSLIPGLELRAGIPTGVALGLPLPVAVAASVAGNALQIGAALWLVKWATSHTSARRFPALRRWLDKTQTQVGRHGPLIRRFGWIGLAVFVLLPLPATGVWGGVILSRILQLSARSVWMGLSVGLALSGAVVAAVTKGGLALWSLL